MRYGTLPGNFKSEELVEALVITEKNAHTEKVQWWTVMQNGDSQQTTNLLSRHVLVLA